MAGTTAIEWTDSSWNPVTGCDRVSPGCAHCYALDLAPRLRAMGSDRYVRARNGGRASGPAFGVTLQPDVLTQPFRWRKPRRVFVNSMSDLFHDEVPDDYIARAFAVMADAPQHTFQVLTKRPERMRDLLKSWRFCKAFMSADVGRTRSAWPIIGVYDDGFEALRNVWLGVSVENRRYVHRADVLRDTPAAVRFVSVPLDLRGIDWLIVGGESGPQHRPIRETWVRDLRDYAASAGTAFFLKQWGGRTPKAGGRLLDGRTYDEMPALATEAAR
jgi:protein gp37